MSRTGPPTSASSYPASSKRCPSSTTNFGRVTSSGKPAGSGTVAGEVEEFFDMGAFRSGWLSDVFWLAVIPDCVQDYRSRRNGLEWIICPTVPVVPLIAPHPMSGARVRPHDVESDGTRKRGGFDQILLPVRYPLYERFPRAAWSCASTGVLTR